MTTFARSLWLFDDDQIGSMTENVTSFLTDARDPGNDIDPNHAIEAQAVLDDLLAESSKRGGIFEIGRNGKITSRAIPKPDRR